MEKLDLENYVIKIGIYLLLYCSAFQSLDFFHCKTPTHFSCILMRIDVKLCFRHHLHCSQRENQHQLVQYENRILIFE